MKLKNYNLQSKIEDTTILPKAKTILKSSGLNTIDDLTNLTKKELKQIKGLGRLGLASVELFLHEAGLTFKKEVKEKDSLFNFKKELIFKFLKDTSNIDWSSEIKAATILLKNNPNLDFWKNFNLPFKLNSLYFLVSQKGKEFIFAAKQQKQEIPTFKGEKIELNNEKIGSDIIQNKPKSIKDFLNE